MYLWSLANHTPEGSFTQRECWEHLSRSELPGRLRPGSVALLEKLLLRAEGIATRQFAVESLDEVFFLDAEALSQRYEREAPKLAARALQDALDEAEVRAEELDALIVCTCTGYLCPGVSSHVAERCGLGSTVQLLDLSGLGCGAALPMLRTARAYLHGGDARIVACVAVEICSAAFYLDDDPGVLISACLFGDGASASVWSAKAPAGRRFVEMGEFQTLHRPESREKIRFVNAGGKLRNQLDPCVPELAGHAVAELFEARRGSRPEQVLAHGGGAKVVNALEARLGYRLHETSEVLKRHGNMSSPSVLFALKERLKGEPRAETLWLTAFGAGFSCHGCTVRTE